MTVSVWGSHLATVVLAGVGTLGVGTPDDGSCGVARLEPGVVGYGCEGQSEPTCDLTAPARYCVDDLACWTALPSPIPESSWPQRPTPDAVWTYRFCAAPGQGYRPYWHWHVPRAEESWEAAGRLAAPEFTLRSNPPRMSVVNLATWFWAAGVDDAPIRGTSAAGLVVVGTPDAIEIDPGDGSSVLTCPWSSKESDACTHTYPSSSVDGPVTSPAGQPAFEARARLVYSLHAQRDGRTVDIPGLPDELRSAWTPTPVPVAEVHTVTTPGGGA